MHPIFAKLFTFFTNVILPIIVGYFIKRTLQIKKERLDILIFINIMVVLPIALTFVFWDLQLDMSMILLPILGFISPLVSGLLGYVFSKGKYDKPTQKGSYVISSMLSNRGTIGGLTMYILFGEIGYAYVNLIILFAGINVFFIAFPLGNYYANRLSNERATFKSIIFRKTNLPVVGVVVGLLLNAFAGERPESIAPYVDLLVKSMAWMALIPIGASINFHGVKKHLKKVLDIGIIKFLIMPALTAAIAYPLIPDFQMATTLVLINTMPVAINAVVVSKLTKLDENVAIAAFLYTVTVYLLIIFPIVAAVLT